MNPALAPLALVVGLVMGALGGGGAVLCVPVLVYLAGQPPQVATAGSLVVVGAGALVGVVPHLRAGRVRVAEGLAFGVLGAAGATAGSALSPRVPEPVLMTAFAALLLLVAALMVRSLVRGTDSPGDVRPVLTLHPLRVDLRRAVVVVVAATAVGLLTGFFGVGGGFAVVPALVLALGFRMPQAVATSLLVIAMNSATSLLTRAAHGLDVSWAFLLPFGVLVVVGTLLGGRLGQHLAPRTTKGAFAVLLLGVAAYTAVRYVPQLLA